MLEAASGGMSEVELGKLAARKGGSADVKSFGERMVRDHSKANLGLKLVTLPATLTKEQMLAKQKLEKLTGAESDREYVAMIVEDHDKDVSAFEEKPAAPRIFN